VFLSWGRGGGGVVLSIAYTTTTIIIIIIESCLLTSHYHPKLATPSIHPPTQSSPPNQPYPVPEPRRHLIRSFFLTTNTLDYIGAVYSRALNRNASSVRGMSGANEVVCTRWGWFGW
jgi:hypothetical protein